MKEIKELLGSGRVVVAKAGEAATPEQLAEAVLEYCEATGYTIEDVNIVELALYRAVTNNTRKCREDIKFSVGAEPKERL